VDCVKRMYGMCCKEYQIVQQGAELTRACEFVCLSPYTYWAMWAKLYCRAQWIWNQLKMDGCDDVADELNGTMGTFWDRTDEAPIGAFDTF
ncbi:uncharacterized protein TM35_000551350, partial [Trypanosoma theileri]